MIITNRKGETAPDQQVASIGDKKSERTHPTDWAHDAITGDEIWNDWADIVESGTVRIYFYERPR